MKKTKDKMPGGIVFGIIVAVLFVCGAALMIAFALSELDWLITEQPENVGDSPLMIGIFFGVGVISLVISIVVGVITHRKKKVWLKRKDQPLQPQDVAATASASEGQQTAARETSSGASRDKNGKAKLPNSAWFAAQGMPLKEIPIDKKQLKKGFSDEEKYILSVASFAIAKKKALIMLGIIVTLLVVLLVGLIIDDLSTIIIAIVALLFGGGFLTYKTTRLLEGMSILNASKRIGIPLGWSFLFGILQLVGNLLSFYMFEIYILFDMSKREAMTSMPRVAMPQNYEFDDIISVYSAYEQSASMSQAWDEHVAHLEKDNYERKTRELNDLKSEVKSSDELTSSEKSDLLGKIESKQQKLDDDYEKNTKSRL